MSTIEAVRNWLARKAVIDLSQSVGLSISINSATRLIGRDMRGPEIRAAHDKIALVATRLITVPSILDEIVDVGKGISSLEEEITVARRTGESEKETTLTEGLKKNYAGFEELYKQLEKIRGAAGLTLSEYDFSRPNPFSGGWGLVVFGLGSDAREWNKSALLVPDTTPIQKETPMATAIEISLAQLSFPYSDVPNTVQARMVPLVSIDAQGVKLDKLQTPLIYKIYNAQHVLTTINLPLFHPRLVYPGK